MQRLKSSISNSVHKNLLKTYRQALLAKDPEIAAKSFFALRDSNITSLIESTEWIGFIKMVVGSPHTLTHHPGLLDILYTATPDITDRPAAYYNIMKGYFELGDLEKARDMLKQIAQQNIHIPPDTFVRFISALLKQHRATEAITLFKNILHGQTVKRTQLVTTCNEILHVLGQNRDLETTLELLELVKTPQLKVMCPHLLSKFMKVFNRCNAPLISIRLYETYIPLSFTSDSHLTSCLLHSKILARQFEHIGDLFNRNQSSSSDKNIIDPTIFINYFLKQGKLDQALSLYRQMKEHSDVVMSTVVLLGLLKMNKTDEANNVLRSIDFQRKEEGRDRPDLVLFSALAQSFFRQGNFEEGTRAYVRLKQLGLPLDQRIYETMIRGFCDICDIESLKEIEGEIKAQRLLPNLFLSLALHRSSVLQKDAERANALWERIKSLPISPSSHLPVLYAAAMQQDDKMLVHVANLTDIAGSRVLPPRLQIIVDEARLRLSEGGRHL
jgi:pentatricopeptide repeat protein